jgi:hypothetical protein
VIATVSHGWHRKKMTAETAITPDWLEREAAADGPRIGALGLLHVRSVRTAAVAKWPDSIKAAASIYDVALITEAPDSPHELLGPCWRSLPPGR